MPLVEVLDSYCYIWCCCASSLLTAFCVEGVHCIHLVKRVRCSVLQTWCIGETSKLLYLNLLSGVTRLSLLPGWWECVNFDKTHPTLGNLFLSQFGSEINKKLSLWKFSCVAGRRLSMTCNFVMYVMRCKLSMYIILLFNGSAWFVIWYYVGAYHLLVVVVMHLEKPWISFVGVYEWIIWMFWFCTCSGGYYCCWCMWDYPSNFVVEGIWWFLTVTLWMFVPNLMPNSTLNLNPSPFWIMPFEAKPIQGHPHFA